MNIELVVCDGQVMLTYWDSLHGNDAEILIDSDEQAYKYVGEDKDNYSKYEPVNLYAALIELYENVKNENNNK